MTILDTLAAFKKFASPRPGNANVPQSAFEIQYFPPAMVEIPERSTGRQLAQDTSGGPTPTALMIAPLFPVLLVGAAALASSPAHAETFNGPYVGVTAGWDQDKIANRTIDAQPIDSRISRDALVLGGYLGYNRKATDKVVIGAEAGFSANVDDDLHAASGGQTLTVDPRYSFDFTARGGYLVTPRTLVYVRGGYANNRVRTTLATPDGSVRDARNLDGWLVGGGVEYAITPAISARAEYRYNDFRHDGGRYDRHQTLVGVSYNF